MNINQRNESLTYLNESNQKSQVYSYKHDNKYDQICQRIISAKCQRLGIRQSAHQSQFTRQETTLFLGNIKANVEHAVTLSQLYLAYTGVFSISFSDCQLSQQVMESIVNYDWKIVQIKFKHCQYKISLFDSLSNPFYQNLSNLTIQQDSFGNQSFKRLARLYLPKLEVLSIKNTKITTDAVKTLLKMTGNHLRLLILQQKINFQYYRLIKQIRYVRTRLFCRQKICSLGLNFLFYQRDLCYLYLNSISKYQIYGYNSVKLLVKDDQDLTLAVFYLETSWRARNILKEFIDRIDYISL